MTVVYKVSKSEYELAKTRSMIQVYIKKNGSKNKEYLDIVGLSEMVMRDGSVEILLAHTDLNNSRALKISILEIEEEE